MPSSKIPLRINDADFLLTPKDADKLLALAAKFRDRPPRSKKPLDEQQTALLK